jgi:hypothetical protein
MDSNIIIIILLIILISLYIWDIMNRECFYPYDDNIFMHVDYNTRMQNCGSLTGPETCGPVKTVRPRRKEICDKELNFERPDKRIGNPSPNSRQIIKYGNQKQVDFGMSMDELDDVNDENEVDSEMKLELDDNVLYNEDKKREFDNKKIIQNIIKYDEDSIRNEKNTLSDVDEQIISLN